MPYRAPFITEMDEPRFTDCQFCAGLMLVAEWTEGEAIHDRHGHRLAVLRRRDAGTAVQRRAPTAADAGGSGEPPGGPRGGQGSDHDSPVTGARGCGQSRRGGATMTNLTVASLLTEAGARTAARLVTTLVELLKDGVGFRAPTASGAALAFGLSALLYILAGVATGVDSLDEGLVVFVAWLTCVTSAVGLYSTITHGELQGGG